MSRLTTVLQGRGNRPLVIPFLTAGYPSPALLEPAVTAMARVGADIVEIGVPFSDPLADGPTIQRASERALAQGVTTAWILEAVRRLRTRPATAALPLLLMGYYNPILRYGVKRFVGDAAAAGVDGIIVPDLPPEEASELRSGCVEAGLAMIFLVAPNAPDERIRLVDAMSTHLSYCVAFTGVTGARGVVQDRTVEFLQRVAGLARKPFVVGFGVKTAEHLRRLGPHAAGVVVGSALIDAMDASDDPVAAAAETVAELRRAAEAIGKHTATGAGSHNVAGQRRPTGHQQRSDS